jgi:S-adenosylmethionine:diacylglycerol 3-amino-3-carboxypropyl transferase
MAALTTSEAETPWVAGRFDARVSGRQVLFGRMYEDPAIELDAFRGAGRVLCIASAGCTAMKLAPHHEVVAIDINPVQLAYAAQRFAGEPPVRGKAERVMDFMRFFAPLLGWWPSVLRRFLELDDPTAQATFWRERLDTWRLRAALGLAFSFTALRAVYSSRFLDFLPRRLGAVFHQRLARGFAHSPNRSNPWARALLLGELSTDVPPPEVKRVQLVHADAASYLEGQPPQSFEGFTLSNILDGAAPAYRERLFAAVKRAAKPGAKVVLRSFGEPSGPLPTNRAADDRSMLWGIVDVRLASDLDAGGRS